jgi:hypothetical protein
MKVFRSISDVEQLRNDPIYDTVKQLVATYTDDPNYRPQDDGYVVLIEPDAVDRVLNDLDIPYRLAEVPFEVVTMIDGCYYGLYLANNQFGISFLIPDAEWLPDELRRHLEENLDP